jgi:hypothetical protein
VSFLYPAFLIGALAIAIPIALHLLRRDVAPEVPFTAVHLLRRSPLEQTRRRRLRDLLLLVARVAALMLLAIAFVAAHHRHRSLVQHERTGTVRACEGRGAQRYRGNRTWSACGGDRVRRPRNDRGGARWPGRGARCN